MAPASWTTSAPVGAGRHDCYDRLVLDISGDPSFHSWHVGYVKGVTDDPTGRPVPLRGGAFLDIVVTAPDHTPNGTPTYPRPTVGSW